MGFEVFDKYRFFIFWVDLDFNLNSIQKWIGFKGFKSIFDSILTFEFNLSFAVRFPDIPFEEDRSWNVSVFNSFLFFFEFKIFWIFEGCHLEKLLFHHMIFIVSLKIFESFPGMKLDDCFWQRFILIWFYDFDTFDREIFQDYLHILSSYLRW